ncbi:MAG: hypothetical protein Q7I95_05215, partial [Thiobacillus sp.]|nr:hypothetical protein [Thiobacillus sp.]
GMNVRLHEISALIHMDNKSSLDRIGHLDEPGASGPDEVQTEAAGTVPLQLEGMKRIRRQRLVMVASARECGRKLPVCAMKLLWSY